MNSKLFNWPLLKKPPNVTKIILTSQTLTYNDDKKLNRYL